MFSPAHYFPIKGNAYEVKAGLSKLEKDFGNEQDGKVFQIDTQWPHYFEQIQQSRSEDLDKYFKTKDLDADSHFALVTYILNRLGEEYPEYYKVYKEKDGSFTLECHLNDDKANFDKEFQLIATETTTTQRPYEDLLDFVCSHIPEDVSLIRVDGKHDTITALHLCLPNHWSAQDKIGKCFAGAHIPVPGMEKINKNIETISQQLLHKGPFTRFAWGLATDQRLNHHPEPPPGIDKRQWTGRRFEPQQPQLFIRVERQCIVGLPKVSSYAFFIRTYLEDVKELRHDELTQLHAAIAGMDEQALIYKGLAESQQDILEYLATLLDKG